MTGFFVPLAGSPTLGVVASNTLAAVLFTIAGYVCFLLADDSWTVTIDALPFFVGFTATSCLQILKWLFASTIAGVLNLLPTSTSAEAVDSSQTSSLIFVLLVTWALFEVKNRFAQLQGQMMMKPSKKHNEDSRLLQ